MVDYAWQLGDKSLNHHHAYIHALLIIETMYKIIEVEGKFSGKKHCETDVHWSDRYQVINN